MLNRLPAGQYPGSVLIKLAVGSLQEFSETAAQWQEEALKLRERTPYLLRVHIYQVGISETKKKCPAPSDTSIKIR